MLREPTDGFLQKETFRAKLFNDNCDKARWLKLQSQVSADQRCSKK